MWLGIHWCHSLPLLVIYSPRLLICLQGECTVGRERGHWNLTFPTVSADPQNPKPCPPSAAQRVPPAANFSLSIYEGTDTLGHLGCTISEDNTKGISEVLVCTYLQDHGRFAQAVFWAPVTYGSFAWLMKCTPIPMVWTIFKRECFFFSEKKKVCMIFVMWIEKLYSPQILETCN